jgi:hypothetical protein
MPETTLNWESAEVKDATLSVELDGEVSKDWKQSFEATVRLLGNGDWGAIKLKKRAVRVDDVVPGEEDKLRFFLESVVSQANATLEAKAEADSAPEEPSEDDEAEEVRGPDAEMTERFRAFSAGGSPHDGEDGSEDSG